MISDHPADGWRLRVTKAANTVIAALVLVVSAALTTQAQTIRAVPTYHNIGVHVQFGAAPPAATTISMAIKEEGAAGEYREIHPLSQISSNWFAGSVFGLGSDTRYAIRLVSAAFEAERVLSVSTCSEVLPEPTNGVYHVATNGEDARDGSIITPPRWCSGRPRSEQPSPSTEPSKCDHACILVLPAGKHTVERGYPRAQRRVFDVILKDGDMRVLQFEAGTSVNMPVQNHIVGLFTRGPLQHTPQSEETET